VKGLECYKDTEMKACNITHAACQAVNVRGTILGSRLKAMTVLGPGRVGARPPHFLSSPSQFFPPTILIIAPHSELGGPAPQSVLARTATA